MQNKKTQVIGCLVLALMLLTGCSYNNGWQSGSNIVSEKTPQLWSMSFDKLTIEQEWKHTLKANTNTVIQLSAKVEEGKLFIYFINNDGYYDTNFLIETGDSVQNTVFQKNADFDQDFTIVVRGSNIINGSFTIALE